MTTTKSDSLLSQPKLPSTWRSLTTWWPFTMWRLPSSLAPSLNVWFQLDDLFLVNNLAISSVYITIIANDNKAKEVFTIQNKIFFFASTWRPPTTSSPQHERPPTTSSPWKTTTLPSPSLWPLSWTPPTASTPWPSITQKRQLYSRQKLWNKNFKNTF